jgi:hypothetical protein
MYQGWTLITVHKLPLIPNYKPMKQKLKRTIPYIMIKVKEDVCKQWEARLLEVVEYHQWVSNILTILK